jgi:hypothetical protein
MQHKVHYYIRQSPQLVPILCRMHPNPSMQPYVPNINFNIINLSTP